MGEQNWKGAAELAQENAQLRREVADQKAEIVRWHEYLSTASGEKDAAYGERNKLVAALAHLFPSGIRRTGIEGWSPDWHGCVYIDLPTGQVSWHYHDSQAPLFADLPPYEAEWDGHDTVTKYDRLGWLGGGMSEYLAAHDRIDDLLERMAERAAEIARLRYALYGKTKAERAAARPSAVASDDRQDQANDADEHRDDGKRPE